MPQQVPQEKSFDDGVDLAESVADPNPEVPAGKWQSLKGFFSRKKS
jgi:hypothetical protein